MKKDAIYLAIIILLLGFIVVMTCQSPPPDPAAAIYEDSVKVLKADKAIIAAQIERVIETSNYKAKVSDSLLALKEKEITRLKVKASQARTPKVDTLILDNPELKVFVENQDSVIQEQGILIDTLKSQIRFEREVRESLMTMHYDADKITANLLELRSQRIVTLEKDLKKKNRGVKFWKAAAVALGVGGLLIGSSLQ